MEFRIEKRAGALLISLGLMTVSSYAQEPELHYQVWRGKSRVMNLPPHVKRTGNLGKLTVTTYGIGFVETGQAGKKPKNPKIWRWAYQDIEQLKISPTSLTVLTYKDAAWKLGADRQYDFDIASKGSFNDAYELLKSRLDQRFVAEIPAGIEQPLWEIPVKRQVGWSGDEGVLQVSATQIVYKSAAPRASRTWRYQDIDNIASAGPFDLTITTFERAKLDYGSRKQFHFELKQRLEESRYDDLWLRLNQSKGLQVLTTYRENRLLETKNDF